MPLSYGAQMDADIDGAEGGLDGALSLNGLGSNGSASRGAALGSYSNVMLCGAILDAVAGLRLVAAGFHFCMHSKIF